MNGMVLFAFLVVANPPFVPLFVCVCVCFPFYRFYVSNRFLGNYSRMRDVLSGIQIIDTYKYGMYQKYL